MNFLACDGSWSVGVGGEVLCSGTPITVTGEQMRAELQVAPSISDEEFLELKDVTISLFTAVFCFLVMKKLL